MKKYNSGHRRLRRRLHEGALEIAIIFLCRFYLETSWPPILRSINTGEKLIFLVFGHGSVRATPSRQISNKF